MGVALLNTRAGDVVESGKSHKIFQEKSCGTLWLLLKSQVRVKGMFSEHSSLVISVTLRVFEISADTVARNHVAGKVRGGRASV